MKTNRIGMIGAGSWATKIAHTINEMSDADDIEIIALCRRKNERPDWLPNKAMFFTDEEEFFKEGSPFCTHLMFLTNNPDDNLRLLQMQKKYDIETIEAYGFKNEKETK